MKFKLVLLNIAIVILLWLYFFKGDAYKKADFSEMNYTKVKTYVDTIYQTKTFTRYKKGDSIPYVIISTDTVQIPVHDTIRIITEYYNKKAYSDTIKVDSSTFVIDDTISQNKILSRGFTAKITTKTIVQREYYATKPRYDLYWGIRGDFRPSNGLEVLSPSLLLNAKNKALIGFSVDINKNYNIGYSGSLYFKLGKK